MRFTRITREYVSSFCYRLLTPHFVCGRSCAWLLLLKFMVFSFKASKGHVLRNEIEVWVVCCVDAFISFTLRFTERDASFLLLRSFITCINFFF